MKPFDPKNRKGAYGDSPRRDRSGDSFNREDSRSSSHREDALSSFSKDKRPRISRPAKPHGTSSDNPYDRRGDEQRRSFNPNFTKDNRLKSGSRDRDDRPYGKPKYGANRDDRYNRENRGDRFDKDDRYRKNDRFEREDRPQRDGNRYNKDDRFNRNDRPDRFDKDERYRKNDRPEREDRPWRKDDRPSGSYKPQRRDESQPYGERPRFQKDGDRKGGFGKKWDRSDSSRGARTHDSRFKKDRKEDYPRYDAPKPQGAIRLNRFIANSGICSRREADDLITAGVVAVNGKIVTELGTKVNPEDEVRFNGEIVKGEKKVYILMNKPKGFVTSVEDPHSDKTVMDLIKGACTERVYPVGRLDKNSVGVLLFTNDGDLTRKLTHPSYNKQKIYQVTLDKPLSEEDMTKIAEGITLEDGPIFADEVSYVSENRKEVGIEIHSGKNRIVRRIFESLGYSVQKLDRVYFAGLTKKRLKRGGWRFLSPREVSMLKSGEYEYTEPKIKTGAGIAIPAPSYLPCPATKNPQPQSSKHTDSNAPSRRLGVRCAFLSKPLHDSSPGEIG